MPKEFFAHVDTWVFDLDNTLYPAECHLFAQIDARMASFIQARLGLEAKAARRIQKDYYAKYGTTLSGLMIEHDVPPADFMDYVHDIDLTPVLRNDLLRIAISSLPGRKYIFTNGSVKHAENVATAIGIFDVFDGVFDIEMSGFTPKPHAEAYDRFYRYFGINPAKAAMFEDMQQNLVVPFETGVRTVLVQSDVVWFDDEPEDKCPSRVGEQYDHVNHVTSDLTPFLQTITPGFPV